MGLVADAEQRYDEQHSHSFAPLEWPSDVSQVRLNREEEQEKRNLKLPHSRESCLVLDKHKRYLPCHYFDYIGGSSTGGYVNGVSAYQCLR